MSADTERLEPIAQFCQDRGLPWDDQRADRMGRYLDLLLHFDETLSLIGPDDPATIVDELLVDSLVAAAARRPEGRLLDVGTGAGLPAIPLNIVFPDIAPMLVEPKGRRNTFLKIATHRLGLDNAEIFKDRIEEFDQGGFDYTISKAFEDPVDWLETARSHTAPTGAIVCMAREQDRDELVEAGDDLDLGLVDEASIGEERPDQRVCYVFERR